MTAELDRPIASVSKPGVQPPLGFKFVGRQLAEVIGVMLLCGLCIFLLTVMFTTW